MPKQAMTWYPIGRKKRKGRSKITWMDEIHGLMGLEEEDWRD